MTDTNARLNLSAGVASVVVALALIGLKLWALAATGALSVAASLVDNALDLLMSLGALAAIAYAARPADDDHAFGHSSAEDLAALTQAAVVLVSACAIAVLAILRLTATDAPVIAAEGAGVVAMLASVVLTGALVLWQRHVAARTGNRVVAADSLHYLSDLLPTLGVLVALAASSVWGATRIDAVVALAAALWLARTGAGIGRGAWDALMDHAAPPQVLARIREVADGWPGLAGWHDLKTRTAGSRLFVSLHVELDGRLTLNEAHAIADGLEHALESALPGAEVIIHTDPVGPGSGRVAKAARLRAS
jgi:ferrous-iron efflux pump FieF